MFFMAKRTIQTRREILKSAAYGMSTKKICEVYRMKEETAKSIIKEGKEEIAQIKEHYEIMEGDE